MQVLARLRALLAGLLHKVVPGLMQVLLRLQDLLPDRGGGQRGVAGLLHKLVPGIVLGLEVSQFVRGAGIGHCGRVGAQERIWEVVEDIIQSWLVGSLLYGSGADHRVMVGRPSVHEVF